MLCLDMSVAPMSALTDDNRGLNGVLRVREQTMVPGPGPVDVFDDCLGKALTEVGPACHGPRRSQ